MNKKQGILSMKLGSSYEVKYNNRTEEYDCYNNGSLIPRQINTLYKYLNFNENTIASLMGSYFWLANPATFNDPFDCNKNLIVDYSQSDEEKNFEKARNHFDDIGIASFSESINNPIMWAHYTNNYNGIVLELDSNNLHLNSNKYKRKKYQLRKVIYPEFQIPLQKGFKFAETLMLTSKLYNWQYENEWRIIASVIDENRYLQFDPNIVKSIFIGYNLYKNNSSAFHIISNIHDMIYPNADLYWMFPHKEKFGFLIGRKIKK